MVKPFRAGAVLAALESVEILGGTVREAMGYGRQKNRLHRYLGSEYNASFLPKVELTLFVREQDVPAAVKAIVGQARTGSDGRRQDRSSPLAWANSSPGDGRRGPPGRPWLLSNGGC